MGGNGALDMSAPYQLWHADGTRALRILWLMEEMELRELVDLHLVSFPPRLRQPAYLDVNPLGSLPYFVHGETRMTESMAICQYLVARHGPTSLAVSPDEPGYADYLQFSFFGEAALMPPVGMMVRYYMLDAPERRSARSLEDARATFQRRQAVVSRALKGQEYLAGERFTLADISVAYSLGLARRLGEQDCMSPDVAAYLDRMSARPARMRADAAAHREAA